MKRKELPVRKLLVGIALAVLVTAAFANEPEEIRNLGINPTTFSFLGTAVFAVLGSWGLLDQYEKIRTGKSGEAVSVTWFAVFLFMFSSSFLYGVDTDRVAVMFHGALRVMFVAPVLLVLWKYKGFKQYEKLIFLPLAAALAVNVFSAHKDWFYIVFQYLGAGSAVLQVVEIYTTKSRGRVSIKMLIIYTASVASWLVYGISVSDKPILYVTIGYMIVYVTTTTLWFAYPESKPERKPCGNN